MVVKWRRPPAILRNGRARMKLRTKFAFATLVLVESVLAVGIVVQQDLERRHLEGKLRENQSEALARLASVAQDAMVARQDVILLNYLKVLMQNPTVLYAALLDSEGRVRLHSDILKGSAKMLGQYWQGPKGESPQGVSVEEVSQDGRRASDWSLGVYAEKRKMGTVHVGYDASALEGLLRKDLSESLTRFLLAAGILSLLGLAGAVFLAYNLNRPIQDLRAAAARLSSGDLSHQVEVRRSDELGELGHAFNAMARQLSELNQIREDLLASITHDLKAPIMAIRGYAELLLGQWKESGEEEVRESLTIIHETSQKLSAMTDEILDFAAVGSARMKVTKRLLDLAEVVRSVVKMLKVVAAEVQVNLEAEIPEEVVWVPADPDRIRRVLSNLIYNALKFTPAHGLVAVSYQVRGDEVLVKVADTGVGIPEGKLGTLFERYVQVEETKGVVRKEMGTGLGLAICREIVTGHGGRIWAESQLGRGATILFTLPLGPVARPPRAGAARSE